MCVCVFHASLAQLLQLDPRMGDEGLDQISTLASGTVLDVFARLAVSVIWEVSKQAKSILRNPNPQSDVASLGLAPFHWTIHQTTGLIKKLLG